MLKHGKRAHRDAYTSIMDRCARDMGYADRMDLSTNRAEPSPSERRGRRFVVCRARRRRGCMCTMLKCGSFDRVRTAILVSRLSAFAPHIAKRMCVLRAICSDNLARDSLRAPGRNRHRCVRAHLALLPSLGRARPYRATDVASEHFHELMGAADLWEKNSSMLAAHSCFRSVCWSCAAQVVGAPRLNDLRRHSALAGAGGACPSSGACARPSSPARWLWRPALPCHDLRSCVLCRICCMLESGTSLHMLPQACSLQHDPFPLCQRTSWDTLDSNPSGTQPSHMLGTHAKFLPRIGSRPVELVELMDSWPNLAESGPRPVEIRRPGQVKPQ